MPAYVRGYIVCEGCGKAANATASIGRAWDKTSFWWTLPEGWILYDARSGHGNVRVYCSYGCNKHSAVMGYPTQTGKAPASNAFDMRTMDKIYEMVEASAREGSTADAVLTAMEAVLLAWRKSQEVSR